MHCTWNGKVSIPLRYDVHEHDTPNVLFDFNGSGDHFPNNDPRYFLPYGSENLKIDIVECDSSTLLAEDWGDWRGWPYSFLCKLSLLHRWVLKCANKDLARLNKMCGDQNIYICIAHQASKLYRNRT